MFRLVRDVGVQRSITIISFMAVIINWIMYNIYRCVFLSYYYKTFVFIYIGSTSVILVKSMSQFNKNSLLHAPYADLDVWFYVSMLKILHQPGCYLLLNDDVYNTKEDRV